MKTMTKQELVQNDYDAFWGKVARLPAVLAMRRALSPTMAESVEVLLQIVTESAYKRGRADEEVYLK